MLVRINLFVIYFLSFLFNKLYFNIFKVLKRYIYFLPKKYSIYSIKRKISYFGFITVLCILVFCKIFWFLYYYILFIYKLCVKFNIDLINNWKIKNTKILNLVFWVYWFNILIHLKVLNKKFQNPEDSDLVYFILKWNCYYYYYYILYMCKDILSIIIWLIRQIAQVQWYILYLQFNFYFKIRKLKCIYCIELFIKGFLVIYCFSGIISYIKNIKNIWKWKPLKKKDKKDQNVSLKSKLQFKYHRNKRIIKEKFYIKVKKPLLLLYYSINNSIEDVFYVIFKKTGANSIIYYSYKYIKYFYSICVYLWKSDIIYRFFKLIERKKW